MNLASTLRSQPIAARLRLGFGAMLLMMAGIAAVGLLALQSANQQMREITGAGAAKARLVNAMLETVSTAGIQSRSAAMLNEIDGAQARTQIAAARASLQHYQKQEAELVQLLSAADSPVQHALVREAVEEPARHQHVDEGGVGDGEHADEREDRVEGEVRCAGGIATMTNPASAWPRSEVIVTPPP